MNTTCILHRAAAKALFAAFIVTAAACFALLCPSTAHAADLRVVTESGAIHCYKGGQMVKDAKVRVGKYTYYFGKSGNAVIGNSVKIGAKYWIFDNKGHLAKPSKSTCMKLNHGLFYVSKSGHPAKVGWIVTSNYVRYVKPSGKLMTSGKKQGLKFARDGYAVKNLASKLKITVVKRISKVTKPSWSRAKKLRACWRWALGHGTFVNSSAIQSLNKPAWVQRQAYKTMNSNASECFGCACSFAMMAFELGYKPIVHGAAHVHAFVYVNGKRYDNMSVHLHNMWGEKVFHVTSYAGTTTASKKKSSGLNAPASGTGWVVYKGAKYYFANGRKVKEKWITYKKKRYYLKGSGKAAVNGSYKVEISNKSKKVAYFVFGKTGALKSGSKTRLLKVNGTVYQVDSKGRARSGWSKAKDRYFKKNGAMVTGVGVIGGKIRVFSSAGKYDAKNSTALASAAAAGQRASAVFSLLKTLGVKAKSKSKSNSCRESFISVDGTLAGYGVEWVYSYAGFKLFTYAAPGSSVEYMVYYVTA